MHFAWRWDASHRPSKLRTLNCLPQGWVRGDVAGGSAGVRREGQLVGAVLWQQQPGRSALVWPPGIVSQEPRQTAIQLLEAVALRIDSLGIRLACVLLDQGTDEDNRVLSASHFEHLANLSYLVCSQEHFPLARPPSPPDFEAYHPENHQRFVKLIEETYEGTLDCPGLEGLRDIDDVLAGYRAIGEFSPQRWLIVRCKGRDIGCLLLADHPDQETVGTCLHGSSRGGAWAGFGEEDCPSRTVADAVGRTFTAGPGRRRGEPSCSGSLYVVGVSAVGSCSVYIRSFPPGKEIAS